MLRTPSSSSAASSGRLMPLRIMNSERLTAETPGARSSTTTAVRVAMTCSLGHDAAPFQKRCTRDGPTEAVIS